MPNYRLVAPYLRWGTNLANAIYFPFPSDSVFSGSEPRPGSEFIQLPSGAEAGWRVGTDYVWLGTQRWIPQADTLFYPRCTGWDGTLGVRVALESLQNRQTFSWHPDGRNLLRLPKLNSAGAVANGGVGGWATFTDSGVTGASISYDGVENAFKLTATNPTGVTKLLYLSQIVPSMVGESVVPSVDYKCSGLTGAAQAQLVVQALDAGLAFLSTPFSLGSLTSTAYARANGVGTFSVAMGAGTVYLQVLLILSLPTTTTGTVWFKNAMVRRDSTDTTFIDNPSVDGVYFVEPTQLSPANESDGSRQLVMRMRNPSAPFDGY